jgi:hypothetical protein
MGGKLWLVDRKRPEIETNLESVLTVTAISKIVVNSYSFLWWDARRVWQNITNFLEGPAASNFTVE